MDTRNLSNVFLGNTAITAMYLSGSKVWPQTPTGMRLLTNWINGFSGTQANLATVLVGETFTEYYTLSGSAQTIPGWSNTGSWESSTPYSYTIRAFQNHRNTEYHDTLCTTLAGTTWEHTVTTYPAQTRVWYYPNVTSMGNFEFRHQNAGNDLAYAVTGSARCEMYFPKLNTLGNTAFQGMHNKQVSGSLIVGSVVTASAAWVGNRDYLLGMGWTITYVN